MREKQKRDSEAITANIKHNESMSLQELTEEKKRIEKTFLDAESREVQNLIKNINDKITQENNLRKAEAQLRELETMYSENQSDYALQTQLTTAWQAFDQCTQCQRKNAVQQSLIKLNTDIQNKKTAVDELVKELEKDLDEVNTQTSLEGLATLFTKIESARDVLHSRFLATLDSKISADGFVATLGKICETNHHILNKKGAIQELKDTTAELTNNLADRRERLATAQATVARLLPGKNTQNQTLAALQNFIFDAGLTDEEALEVGAAIAETNSLPNEIATIEANLGKAKADLASHKSSIPTPLQHLFVESSAN